MKALVLQDVNQAEIQDLHEPQPGPGQVLVKIEASGLCTTDRDLITGHTPIAQLPRILGHQGAGKVETLGEGVYDFNVGDRVVSTIDVVCGDCPYCRRGRPNLCQNLKRIGFELDGSHAEYAVIPQANLIHLPDTVPFDQGCILADAVASMYHALVVRGQMKAGDKVVLLGIGGVGIQGVQIARLGGAEVLVTSRQRARLESALQLGANYAVNPEKEDVMQAVSEFTGGEGADIVMDAIGLENTVQMGVEMARPGGKIILFGNIQPTFTASFTDIFMPEKDILGSRANTKEALLAVTDLVADGKLAPLVSRQFPLSDFQKAIAEIDNNTLVGRAVFIP
jgi:2-desacetyl-2-hydroxyethyl bacteriochlorophyllide A dehydrogenase